MTATEIVTEIVVVGVVVVVIPPSQILDLVRGLAAP